MFHVEAKVSAQLPYLVQSAHVLFVRCTLIVDTPIRQYATCLLHVHNARHRLHLYSQGSIIPGAALLPTLSCNLLATKRCHSRVPQTGSITTSFLCTFRLISWSLSVSRSRRIDQGKGTPNYFFSLGAWSGSETQKGTTRLNPLFAAALHFREAVGR